MIILYRSPNAIRFHSSHLLPTSILLHPLLRRLLKLLLVILEIIRNTRLDRIVPIRLQQQIPDQLQHARDGTRRLPDLWAQDAETHGAFVVVCYVGVPDLGLKGDGGRFEREVGGEVEVDLEVAALGGGVSLCSGAAVVKEGMGKVRTE